MKRRRLLTIAWLVGGTLLPAAVAVVVFGCCRLPFHGLVHRYLPLCELATEALAHHHDGDDPAIPAPSRSDERPAVARLWRPGETVSLAPQLALVSALAPLAPGQDRRRVLPVGAFRCDDDVGARLAFVETLRI